VVRVVKMGLGQKRHEGWRLESGIVLVLLSFYISISDNIFGKGSSVSFYFAHYVSFSMKPLFSTCECNDYNITGYASNPWMG